MCATRGARSAFSSVLALVLLVSGSPALPLTAAAPTQINTVVATIPVGNHPQGVAYDLGNGYVYVTDGGSRAVSVIDASTNTVVGNVTVGPGPSGIAYDQGNGRIYVTDSLSSSPSIVSVIDGSTRT
jgi:YVTN family beta-propeller protein